MAHPSTSYNACVGSQQTQTATHRPGGMPPAGVRPPMTRCGARAPGDSLPRGASLGPLTRCYSWHSNTNPLNQNGRQKRSCIPHSGHFLCPRRSSTGLSCAHGKGCAKEDNNGLRHPAATLPQPLDRAKIPSLGDFTGGRAAEGLRATVTETGGAPAKGRLHSPK